MTSTTLTPPRAPLATPTVPFAALAAALGPPATRVGIDWDALAALNPAVQVRVTRGPVNGAWFTPWYTTSAGRLCDWDTPGARPLTVAAAARHTHYTDPERADRLRDLTLALHNDPGIPQLLTVTWALPHGGRVIAAGNHRIVAAYRTALPVALVELTIHGPLDPALLPDLTWHARS